MDSDPHRVQRSSLASSVLTMIDSRQFMFALKSILTLGRFTSSGVDSAAATESDHRTGRAA